MQEINIETVAINNLQDLELFFWFLKDIYSPEELESDEEVCKLLKKEFNLNVTELEIYNLKKILIDREVEDAVNTYNNVI